MKWMIDGFGGLGGASEAFIDDDEWGVVRLDNNPLLKDVENMVITEHMFDFIETLAAPIELLWFSPPCVAFSDGYSSPKNKARRAGVEYKPDMSLIVKSLEIIEKVKPRFWVIENVRGAQPFFEGLLGKPSQIIGSVYLWGNFPFINMPVDYKHPSKYENDSWSSDPLRANKRAKIPYEISMCLKIACCEHRTLLEWC